MKHTRRKLKARINNAINTLVSIASGGCFNKANNEGDILDAIEKMSNNLLKIQEDVWDNTPEKAEDNVILMLEEFHSCVKSFTAKQRKKYGLK